MVTLNLYNCVLYIFCVSPIPWKNMNNTILPDSSKNRLVTKDRERKLIVTPTRGIILKNVKVVYRVANNLNYKYSYVDK